MACRKRLNFSYITREFDILGKSARIFGAEDGL